MRLLIALLLFSLCININAQKGKLILSSWKENGEMELSIPAGNYAYCKKGKFYYSISNSNDKFFIDLRIEDKRVQDLILKKGLMVWVNMESKLNKTMGVRFPVGSQYSEGKSENNLTNTNENFEKIIATPLSKANMIELIGFISEETRRFPADNYDNFRGSVKYDDNGYLNYKMVMPIAKLPVRNSKDGDGAMPFSLGLEYGASPSMNVSGMNPSSVPKTGRDRRGSSRGNRNKGNTRGYSSPVLQNHSVSAVSFKNDKAQMINWLRNVKLAANR
jgi:hypothetical protein